MTEKPIWLDQRRGIAAQKALELRRLGAEVAAVQATLRRRRKARESRLVTAPAVSWAETAEKACYLLMLFATTPAARNPGRRRLIGGVLEDFIRLAAADAVRTGHLNTGARFVIRSFDGEQAVANREQRSNREKRKPKAEKPKPPVQISPFAARPQAAGGSKGMPGKKGR
jgi:hypothetical protein